MTNHAVRVRLQSDTCQNIEIDSIGTLFRYANKVYPFGTDTNITKTEVIE